MLLIDGRNRDRNILVKKVWLKSFLNTEVHFVCYLYITVVYRKRRKN